MHSFRFLPLTLLLLACPAPGPGDETGDTDDTGDTGETGTDDVITEDGLVDMKKLRPLARLGYYDFAVIEAEQIFSMQAPGDDRFATENKSS